MLTKRDMIQFLATKESDKVMHYVGRALVALFNRQLDDEKNTNDTRHDNMAGFSSSDARTGSLGAKYYLKHGRLEDWQVEQWTKDFRGSPRITKYWRQLAEVAEAKAKRKENAQ